MFNDKFNSLSAIVGLSKQEVSTAKFFWYAGVKYALKMSTNVPALLKPKPTIAEEHASRFDFSKVVYNKDSKTSTELTSYEAKFMSLILADMLMRTDQAKSALKQIKKDLWDKCDPADGTTKEYFDALNAVKSELIRLKTQQKTVANVQRKLKKTAKQHV